jgi:hypothetical protein
MHEMPDEWQWRMAALLEEYDMTFSNLPDIGSTVRAVKNGKLIAMPRVFTNYRHPDRVKIERMR